jgi:hypothetical protein
MAALEKYINTISFTCFSAAQFTLASYIPNEKY